MADRGATLGYGSGIEVAPKPDLTKQYDRRTWNSAFVFKEMPRRSVRVSDRDGRGRPAELL
jgi:hypothetical protein